MSSHVFSWWPPRSWPCRGGFCRPEAGNIYDEAKQYIYIYIYIYVYIPPPPTSQYSVISLKYTYIYINIYTYTKMYIYHIKGGGREKIQYTWKKEWKKKRFRLSYLVFRADVRPRAQKDLRHRRVPSAGSAVEGRVRALLCVCVVWCVCVCVCVRLNLNPKPYINIYT